MSKCALLIGINQYEYAADLNGCLADVELMSDVLRGFGFEQQTLVVDPNNSRDEIFDAFETFIEAVEQDDEVVVYYSGHGSQVSDQDSDERDRYDETIVPCDSGGRGDHQDKPVLDIVDDEMGSLVRALNKKTGGLTVIFDSCNSETADRAAASERARDPHVRYVDRVESPLSVAPRFVGEPKDAEPAVKGPGGWLPPGRHIFLSGCKANEFSGEGPHDGATHGHLTYYLSQELQGGGDLTWRTLHERVARLVTGSKPDQHPQIEGPDERLDARPF